MTKPDTLHGDKTAEIRYSLWQLVLYMLRLGALGFGGPVVVIAQRCIVDIPTALLAVGAAAPLWKYRKLSEPVTVLGAA